jgi:hypothetical protein
MSILAARVMTPDILGAMVLSSVVLQERLVLTG